MNVIRFLIGSMLFLILAAPPLSVFADGPAEQRGLTLEWQEQESHGPRSNTWLVIHGDGLPAPIRIHYLEAYVRPNSTDEDWLKSIFGHRTELVAMSDDGRCLRVKDTLSNGLVVDHVITAGVDEVDFRLTATNPTEKLRKLIGPSRVCELGNSPALGQNKRPMRMPTSPRVSFS